MRPLAHTGPRFQAVVSRLYWSGGVTSAWSAAGRQGAVSGSSPVGTVVQWSRAQELPPGASRIAKARSEWSRTTVVGTFVPFEPMSCMPIHPRVWQVTPEVLVSTRAAYLWPAAGSSDRTDAFRRPVVHQGAVAGRAGTGEDGEVDRVPGEEVPAGVGLPAGARTEGADGVAALVTVAAGCRGALPLPDSPPAPAPHPALSRALTVSVVRVIVRNRCATRSSPDMPAGAFPAGDACPAYGVPCPFPGSSP
jgi:hypothetical protein